jgi:hypothetical protein
MRNYEIYVKSWQKHGSYLGEKYDIIVSSKAVRRKPCGFFIAIVREVVAWRMNRT